MHEFSTGRKFVQYRVNPASVNSPDCKVARRHTYIFLIGIFQGGSQEKAIEFIDSI